MKTRNVPCRRLATLSIVTLWACLSGCLIAAEKTVEPPATTAESKPSRYDLQIIDGHLIRPNGKVEATLPNVVEALRDQYTEANIIITPGLARIRVGDLKLRAGLLAEELEAVRVASGEKFEIQLPTVSNALIDPTTGLPPSGGRSVNAGLFVLREGGATSRNPRIVEAFNIGPYLQWSKLRKGNPIQQTEEDNVDQIQKMISDTLGAFKEDATEQPAFRYHRGATLLVIIGNVDAVEIARKVILALPGMSTLARSEGGGGSAFTDPRSVEDEFRKRYGLVPSANHAPQSEGAAPDSQPGR